jgi:hypothetical protein
MFCTRALPVVVVVLGLLGGPCSSANGKKTEQEVKKAEPDDYFKYWAKDKGFFTVAHVRQHLGLRGGGIGQLVGEEGLPDDAKINLEKYLQLKERAAARWGELKLGEKRAGELTPYSGSLPNGKKRGDEEETSYGDEFRVPLVAGQNIAIHASVVGEGRSVALQLLDPAHTQVGGHVSAIKNGQLVVKELNATGKYWVRVTSSHIGPYTVTVFERTADIKALEARIEQLEKELAAARAKLQELLPKK